MLAKWRSHGMNQFSGFFFSSRAIIQDERLSLETRFKINFLRESIVPAYIQFTNAHIESECK